MADFPPYNPLDKKNLGASVADALLVRDVMSLKATIAKPFNGAGIYALYYTGGFAPYEPLAKVNRDKRVDETRRYRAPIYVGKAVPEGARKGGKGLNGKPGRALHARLNDHLKSIQAAATTLDVADFQCRFLVVEDIWIPLGESLLIAKFVPVWNMVVEGFGNHAPGKGRYQGKIPLWDVLHPGRDWALRCEPRKETADDIIAKVEAHFRRHLEMASSEVRGISDLAKYAPEAIAVTENGDDDTDEDADS